MALTEDTKNIIGSKTVWSAIITILAITCNALGFEFGTENQEALVDAILAIVAAVGAVFAIIFRVRATKVVKVLPE